MPQERFYTIFHTDDGWMGLLGSTNGLQRVTLPRHSREEVVGLITAIASEAVINDNPFTDLAGRLRAYFSGDKVEFPDKLDLSGATAFQRDVWKAAREIPYGETRSYGWLARRIGRPKAARAVGQALASNPFPVIVPCHRVLAGDGSPGGFSGGIKMKSYLLRLEGMYLR
jgi:methylated-DNA-[protein]-cysteine S-methyltransferase